MRLSIFTFVVAVAAPAFADREADLAEGKRLFEEGRVLLNKGDAAGACAKFARSLEFDHHAIGTQLNLGDCNERLGHIAEAWRWFDTAATEFAGDERATFARSHADALLPRLLSVVVKLPLPTIPDLKVTIGGRSVQPAGEIHDLVDPGSVEVVVTAPTRSRFAQTVRGIAGATVSVEVPASEPTSDTRTERRRGRVHIAWLLSAAGAGSAIASTALIIKAKRDYDDAVSKYCTKSPLVCFPAGDKAIADSQRLGWISTGFAAGAGVLLAGAAVVYFTAPRDSVVVSPVATESSAGVVLSGRF
jgi:hypothetical protein